MDRDDTDLCGLSVCGDLFPHGFLFSLDEGGFYQIGAGNFIHLIFPSFVLILCIFDNLRAQLPLRRRIPLLAFCLIPLLVVVSSAFFSRYAYGYAVSALVMLLMYGVIQMERSIELAQQKQLVAEQNRDLLEKQTQIMLYQIQPHFLFNALTAISYLCRTDSLEAAQAVERFAGYLRMNMATLESRSMVPFEKELEHTKTYLWIEQLRKDLLDTFEALGEPGVIRSSRGSLSINREAVHCDYFDYRDGKLAKPSEEYMEQYDFL